MPMQIGGLHHKSMLLLCPNFHSRKKIYIISAQNTIDVLLGINVQQILMSKKSEKIKALLYINFKS